MVLRHSRGAFRQVVSHIRRGLLAWCCFCQDLLRRDLQVLGLPYEHPHGGCRTAGEHRPGVLFRVRLGASRDLQRLRDALRGFSRRTAAQVTCKTRRLGYAKQVLVFKALFLNAMGSCLRFCFTSRLRAST